MKQCTKCKTLKAEQEFSWLKTKQRPASWCKQCVSRNSAKWYAKNRQRVLNNGRKRGQSEAGKRLRRERHLRRSYGISPAEYDAILVAQGGRCAICK